MSVIRQKAEEIRVNVCNSEQGRERTELDPFTILIAIQIITALINLWRACRRTPAQAVDESKSLGMFATMKLKRMIRRHVGGNKEQCAAVEAAIRESLGKVTEPEMAAMFQEAKG